MHGALLTGEHAAAIGGCDGKKKGLMEIFIRVIKLLKLRLNHFRKRSYVKHPAIT